ncbi:MAG: PEP-CTERM sorting domain-containing protein [Phycisphaerae bacterium]|nr:PEP-CTERM sorting domain-containing protein [Phycisphaerae bacterium]
MRTQAGWIFIAIIVMMTGTATLAADVVLTDRNATATFDLESSAGMKGWTVDGTDHLFQQWFWYRIGNAGGESSIDTLGLDIGWPTDTDGDGQCEHLFVRYVDQAGNFKIEIDFELMGGTNGSGTSDLAESISIINTSATTLDFHFFQYCDFDLNGTLVDERVEITGGNTAIQENLGYTIAETVETPLANHYEVGVYNGTLASLSDALPTTLGDVAGPLTNADLTWAFQWDFTLAPGGTFIISKDKLIVPEPATLCLLGSGLLVLLRRRKCR